MVYVHTVPNAETSKLAPNSVANWFGAEFDDDEPTERRTSLYQCAEMVFQLVL